MHFLITAIGSYGDVHPMVGIGVALTERGHRVSLVANPYFEALVEDAGLEFLPLGTRDDYLELVANPDLWHPLRGQLVAFRWGCVRVLRRLYELVTTHRVPGETVLAVHGLDMASRVAAEKFDIPIASINFAPSAFISAHQPARIPTVLAGKYVPRWVTRTQYWLGERLVIEPLFGSEVNRLRRELGMSPVHGFLTNWWHATDVVIGLFPDWFGPPPPPDWPAGAELTGFPLWDGARSAELSDDVRAFLDDGEPPIVFTPGSANSTASGFFVAAVDACQRLGRRGMLLTKFSEQLPEGLPRSVRHFEFVPLGQVLPRAAAFVHHGGIGSSAQGLAAGVPQVVRPLAFDQFDNSRHLVRLGVSAEIPVKKFHGQNVAPTLDRLIGSPDVATKCQHAASQCDGPAAIARACDALETLVPPAVAR